MSGSNVLVAPFIAMISLAIWTEAADGGAGVAGFCCALAAPAKATLRATTAPSARKDWQIVMSSTPFFPLSRAFDDAGAVRSGKDSGLREADEQTVFDHARDRRQPVGEPPRLGNPIKPG